MSDDPDVDIAAVRDDVAQIKEAMGIAERYEQTAQWWLGYAVMVAVAATGSQVVVLQRLSPLYHSLIWLGVIGGGTALLGWWAGNDTDGPREGNPRASLVFGVCFVLVIPIQLIVSPFLREVGYLENTAMILGLILLLIGTAYVLLGNLLRAYRIRLADRAALYAGGILIAVLGVAIPNVELLHTWGYASFAGLYVVYALSAYAILVR